MYSKTTDYYPFGLLFRSNSVNVNRYLFSGKELQDQVVNGNPLQLYDFGARNYDPVLGRWFNIDPHANKYYSISPYAYCLNSPVNGVDPTGMAPEPTPEEAALIAKHVYGDKVRLTGGWKLSTKGDGLKLNNEKSGFQAAVYERTKRGSTEYVFATAGTNDWIDVKHDILQPLGLSSQYQESADKAEVLKERIGTAELTYTGHSLGGGLAEANSLRTGDKAITFNAAGVSPLTSGTLKKSNTDAYIMTTDPLNAFQSMTIVPQAGGTQHFLQPKSFQGVVNGHSIDAVIDVFDHSERRRWYEASVHFIRPL